MFYRKNRAVHRTDDPWDIAIKNSYSNVSTLKISKVIWSKKGNCPYIVFVVAIKTRASRGE